MEFVDWTHQTKEEERFSTVHFSEFNHQAGTRNNERKAIAKCEVNDKGPNLRFILTNLEGEPYELYYKVYCARGDMENRIKDQQLDLFADRTSSSSWYANQWRLMLSMFGFVLFEKLREFITDPEIRKMTVDSLRQKLIRFGAVITRNTRSIKFMLSESNPNWRLFQQVSRAVMAT